MYQPNLFIQKDIIIHLIPFDDDQKRGHAAKYTQKQIFKNANQGIKHTKLFKPNSAN